MERSLPKGNVRFSTGTFASQRGRSLPKGTVRFPKGNRRTAAVLIPVIERWILPGSIVYTDEWASYGGLTARGYTHDWVNHSIQFVDPVTGVHTNTQEVLWHHVKRRMSGSKDLESVLLDFMFRRKFNASAGVNQITNAFNGYLHVLKC